MILPSDNFRKIVYFVYPGFITSKNDNDEHYITADTLIWLYKVKKEDCVIIRNELDIIKAKRAFVDHKIVTLSPRYDGDYSLKDEDRNY